MTNRKQALEELREKVKAGTLTIWTDAAKAVGIRPDNRHKHVMNAYNDDLNAAKALHEAVLPEWEYNLAKSFCHVMPPHNNGDQEASTGISDNPSRAWLLAILDALISQEETK